MTRMLRLPVLAVLLVVLASGVALQAAATHRTTPTGSRRPSTSQPRRSPTASPTSVCSS